MEDVWQTCCCCASEAGIVLGMKAVLMDCWMGRLFGETSEGD